MATDHLNVVERKLIDNLRTGTYNTTAGIGSGNAWSDGDITVFGQFPETEDLKYPCIILEQRANGIEQQFMGQLVSSGSSTAIGELYGVGFTLTCAVEIGSSITVDATAYKQRRLINYLMINCANVLMDCDFSSSDTEVVQRHYSGFTDVGYNAVREIWAARSDFVIVFKNTR